MLKLPFLYRSLVQSIVKHKNPLDVEETENIRQKILRKIYKDGLPTIDAREMRSYLNHNKKFSASFRSLQDRPDHSLYKNHGNRGLSQKLRSGQLWLDYAELELRPNFPNQEIEYRLQVIDEKKDQFQKLMQNFKTKTDTITQIVVPGIPISKKAIKEILHKIMNEITSETVTEITSKSIHAKQSPDLLIPLSFTIASFQLLLTYDNYLNQNYDTMLIIDTVAEQLLAELSVDDHLDFLGLTKDMAKFGIISTKNDNSNIGTLLTFIIKNLNQPINRNYLINLNALSVQAKINPKNIFRNYRWWPTLNLSSMIVQPMPSEIFSIVQYLLQDYQSKLRTHHPIIALINLFCNLLFVQPFTYHNGLMAQIILDKELYQNGYGPCLLHEVTRHYFAHLTISNISEQNNLSPQEFTNILNQCFYNHQYDQCYDLILTGIEMGLDSLITLYLQAINH